MEFKLGELFSGPGGMGFGAVGTNITANGKYYSISHGWASDYDIDSCETYLKNVPGADANSIFHCDVSELVIEELPKIDGFAYGFPCNDFSLVGEQKGLDGKFGGLYSYGLRVIEAFNPKFIVAENVGGLSSSNEGKAFEMITEKLKNAGKFGYNLTVHKYKAEEYGVPQKRHRIIIVGIRKDFGLTFNVPAPTTKDNYVTASTALEVPPIPIEAPNNELTKQSDKVVERLSRILPGQNVWNANLPAHLQLNVKGARLSQIYRRLHPNEPSYTITGSGGGGTHVYHYKELRALTNRERARIQSFPDSFVFNGSKESVRKQIGMAVPPLLAKTIFIAILKTFSGTQYPSIEANL